MIYRIKTNLKFLLLICHLFDDLARNVETVGEGVIHDGERQLLDSELIDFEVAL